MKQGPICAGMVGISKNTKFYNECDLPGSSFPNIVPITLYTGLSTNGTSTVIRTVLKKALIVMKRGLTF